MGDVKDNDVKRTIQIGKHKVNYVVLLVHFNIFMYATCFWIQQGVFPVSQTLPGKINTPYSTFFIMKFVTVSYICHQFLSYHVMYLLQLHFSKLYCVKNGFFLLNIVDLALI